MSETLTIAPEQIIPVEAAEGLARLALQGATETAERGGFTLPDDIEAELRPLFDVDPSMPVLPLADHNNACANTDWGGSTEHAYLHHHFRMVTE